jgi:pantoate--beta-alanine ligase
LTIHATGNSSIVVARTVSDLRAHVAAWRRNGERVGLVPTMGALHAGHIALVEDARRRAERVITSIFVNPSQFAPHEDFSKYPRTFDADRAKLAAARCDLIWAPTVPEMYPAGFDTRITPAGAALGLETDFRPHFFSGVATVCCKLFTQTGADVAVFGEKDYQQLQVVGQMVRDLDLPIEIIGYPTVREADGLAMSSRNVYLSAEDRVRAVLIRRTIGNVDGWLKAGVSIAEAEARGTADLAAAGFKVDYVAVRDAATLAALEPGSARPRRILVAAWLGATRLIDNA